MPYDSRSLAVGYALGCFVSCAVILIVNLWRRR